MCGVIGQCATCFLSCPECGCATPQARGKRCLRSRCEFDDLFLVSQHTFVCTFYSGERSDRSEVVLYTVHFLRCGGCSDRATTAIGARVILYVPSTTAFAPSLAADRHRVSSSTNIGVSAHVNLGRTMFTDHSKCRNVGSNPGYERTGMSND